jgi:hypothetical protein
MKRLKRFRGKTSKGFAMDRFPNEDILQFAVEGGAQTGEGVEVYMAGCA